MDGFVQEWSLEGEIEVERLKVLAQSLCVLLRLSLLAMLTVSYRHVFIRRVERSVVRIIVYMFILSMPHVAYTPRRIILSDNSLIPARSVSAANI